MAFVPRRFDQILQDMVNRVIARTPLTDLNDGSVLLQILAASAREDDEQYVQMTRLLDLFGIRTATGDDLDDRARDLNPLVIARNAAVKATGEVTFSRTGVAGTVNIPIGTIVAVPVTDGSEAIEYETTEAGSIPNGNTSSQPLSITCLRAGAVGNVAANKITSIVTTVAGVETVTNAAALTTGSDRETDDAFRDRITEFLRSLSRATPRAIESAAETVESAATGQRIVAAKVLEDPNTPGDFTLLVTNRISDFGGVQERVTVVNETLINPALGGETRFRLNNWPVVEGSAFVLRKNGVPLLLDTDYGVIRSSGEILLYAALAVGNTLVADYVYFIGLMRQVALLIEGDPADIVVKPGYRAAGCFMHLKAPTPQQVVLAANVTVADGHVVDDVFNAVVTAWTTYVNGLGIGEDVLVAELVDRAMDVEGVQNIQGVTIDGGTDDGAIPDDGLAFTSTLLITIT